MLIHGHLQVYCKNCYENRRKVATLGDQYQKMGFRVEHPDKAKNRQIFCAVDDCLSEVTAPTSWVGIFM